MSPLVQATIAALVILLGQAGTTVKGAYDVLVSMSIIGYCMPYLFVFACTLKRRSEPAGPEVMRVPLVVTKVAGLMALLFLGGM